MGSLEKVMLDGEIEGDIAASRDVNMVLDWTRNQTTKTSCNRHATGRMSGLLPEGFRPGEDGLHKDRHLETLSVQSIEPSSDVAWTLLRLRRSL